MVASSYVYVAATEYADALVRSCGWASHLEEYGMVLLLAPLALLACMAYIAYRGGARRNKRLWHMVPSSFVSFSVYAFAVAHMAGWGVCDVATMSSVAAAASVGAVLSGAMFGVYYDVYATRNKGTPWRIVTPVLAVAALAYYVFLVADGRQLLNEVVRQSLVTVAMVVMAIAVGIFGAEYDRNRGRRRIRWWLLPIALVAVGACASSIAASQGSWDVGDGDYAYLYIVQSMWAGMTVAGVMLGALATKFPKNTSWCG